MSRPEIISEKDRFQWGPIPAVPYFLFYAGLGVVQEAYKRYKSWWPEGQLLFYNKDKGIWFGRQSEIDQHGLRAARIFYGNPERLADLKKEYKICQRIINESRHLVTPASLKRLTNNELLKLYRVIDEVYIKFWSIAIQPELTTYGMSAYFTKHIPRYFLKDQVNEAMSILTGSADLTFYQKEELKFLEIIKSIYLPAKFSNVKNFQRWLRIKQFSIYEKLRQHAKEYSWILGNFASGQPLSEAYFFERAYRRLREKPKPADYIRQIIDEFKTTQKKRQHFIKKLPQSKIKFYASLVVGDAVAWFDERKSWQLRAQEVLYYFIQEFSRRYKVPAGDLIYLTAPELWSYLNGSLELPKNDIKARKRLAVFCVSEKAFRVYTGVPAQRLFQAYRKLETHKVKEIKGLVGSIGRKIKIQGRAVILSGPNEASKIKKGDILVAELTSPDYILAIKKAAAIITDHGGLTSHAAIVAREFQIPCIVNTKIATHIFKTGDRVELDTTNGNIKKL